MTKALPLKELLLMRLRELFRTPETIFWVYGFPILLAIGLGIASDLLISCSKSDSSRKTE